MAYEEEPFYKTFPRSCRPDDYWGQVKRTLDGKPVPPEQIDLIVEAICDGLRLEPEDVVLDLCCGNGALSRLVYARCAGGLGVDYSEYLIEVAKRDFGRPPRERYQLQDVVDFAVAGDGGTRYTKGLCYGSFQYLPVERATRLLAELRRNFGALARVFIGNLPDRDKLEVFFTDRVREAGVEDDPASAIGIWWDRATIEAVADRAGWRVRAVTMPEAFYAAHYRFDAILEPA